MKALNSSSTARFSLSVLCTGAIAVGLSLNASAQPALTGTLNSAYGSALALQTVNTGFGDSTIGDGTSAGGSELDAGYGTIQGGELYLFLAGNFEGNGNHVNLFVSDGAAGQSTLALPATGSMGTMNGSSFSPGFNANLALDLNYYAPNNAAYVEEYTIAGAIAAGGYVGSFGTAGGIGSGTPGPNGIVYGFNDTHVSTMGAANAAANPAAMAAANTGLAIGIPLTLLGNPTGPIEVLADINGGGDGYLANQFLSGLPVGTGNLGTSTFNFGSTPGEFFTVPAAVPEPCTLTLLGLGLAGVLSSRRRK
jgi:hypothetical protein